MHPVTVAPLVFLTFNIPCPHPVKNLFYLFAAIGFVLLNMGSLDEAMSRFTRLLKVGFVIMLNVVFLLAHETVKIYYNC